MSSVNNHTPFSSVLLPHVDELGQYCQLLVVKGVWSLRNQGLADSPGPFLGINTAPQLKRIGDLTLNRLQHSVLAHRMDEEIEWFPCDTYPHKPVFDFIVCGYAWSPQPCEQFTASVDYRDTGVELQLLAPRRWKPTLLTGGGGMPGPFMGTVRQVPVHPAFAFGGGGDTPCMDNPQGMGQRVANQDLSTLDLPWLEHPGHRTKTLLSNPTPSGFGPWPASAKQRLRYIGTWDDAWQKERAHLNPLDFDSHHYQQADLRLQWPTAPKAGETITLQNLGPHGQRRIVWPKVQLTVTVGKKPPRHLQPDTCIVSTENDLYALVWRTQIAADASPILRTA